MKSPMIRRSTRWLIAALFLALGGCVAVGDGYYGDDGYYGGTTVGYSAGFYEPFGYDYGGWHPGYRVGPPRGRYDHPARLDSHPTNLAYHPALPSRSVPSIPTRSRGEQSSRGGRNGH